MSAPQTSGTDRIEVVLGVPRDDALPLDVQAVGLRRRAIELMQEIATINENTVRYKGASEDCVVSFGDQVVSTWQMNLIASRFIADGKAEKGVVGPVVHKDGVTRVYSSTSVVRNEFA
jgi:hypothetical protein